jgi:hypothetical protein
MTKPPNEPLEILAHGCDVRLISPTGIHPIEVSHPDLLSRAAR